MSPVPICTPEWRETMWGKVSCLRKQHNGRDWASNHRPSDLKSNVLTTTPLCPHNPEDKNPETLHTQKKRILTCTLTLVASATFSNIASTLIPSVRPAEKQRGLSEPPRGSFKTADACRKPVVNCSDAT